MPHGRDSRKGTTPPLPKGRFDPPHRNVWIAFFRGSATSTNRGRSRNVLQTGRQEPDASVVPLKAVNAVLNEDETEIRTLFLRFLSRCFWMDLALFTKKYRTSGIDGARSSFLSESCVHRHQSCVHRHDSCVHRHESCVLDTRTSILRTETYKEEKHTFPKGSANHGQDSPG